jgi:hypothetical protein
MKTISTLVSITAILASASLASGQGQPSPGVRAATASKGLAALEQATAAQKYLFVFLWKEQNPSTDQAWQAFQTATASATEWADVAAVGVLDPGEKPLVDRYGLNRAPMPLVMAFAPNGAVTKTFLDKLDESQLRAAVVSPCTAQCLKAMQNRKLVLLCVHHSQPQVRPVLPRGVTDFTSDPEYGPVTDVVSLNADDAAEAKFLQELKVDTRTPGPVTVLMAPPGAVVGKFDGAVTKKELVAKLASAQSACGPGGKCGPGGCGPKK